mmetsp:Transcript_33253/g.89001  ORF Transcript_33253/g.89001 Transcript_33253/m.89001 type:complete len:232 (-) Transcript_33253:3-698(-)
MFPWARNSWCRHWDVVQLIRLGHAQCQLVRCKMWQAIELTCGTVHCRILSSSDWHAWWRPRLMHGIVRLRTLHPLAFPGTHGWSSMGIHAQIMQHGALWRAICLETTVDSTQNMRHNCQYCCRQDRCRMRQTSMVRKGLCLWRILGKCLTNVTTPMRRRSLDLFLFHSKTHSCPWIGMRLHTGCLSLTIHWVAWPVEHHSDIHRRRASHLEGQKIQFATAGCLTELSRHLR